MAAMFFFGRMGYHKLTSAVQVKTTFQLRSARHCFLALQHLNTEAEDNRTLFGWNYYPDPRKSKLRPDQLRLLPHADTDVITLLFQKPGNLCKI